MGLYSRQATPSVDLDFSHVKNASLEMPEPNQDSNNQQQPQQRLKCPRCDSTNTKFCYYNNYNRSQPRHLCKACKRHWTQGGTLRNVPVGGARKNKRRKTSNTTTSNPLPADHAPADHDQPLPQLGPDLRTGSFSNILHQMLLNSSSSADYSFIGNAMPVHSPLMFAPHFSSTVPPGNSSTAPSVSPYVYGGGGQQPEPTLDGARGLGMGSWPAGSSGIGVDCWSSWDVDDANDIIPPPDSA